MRKTTVVLREDDSEATFSSSGTIPMVAPEVNVQPTVAPTKSGSTQDVGDLPSSKAEGTREKIRSSNSGIDDVQALGHDTQSQDGDFSVKRRATKNEDNKELLDKLKQRAIEGQEDVFSDLRFLKESVSELEKLAPIMRALLYKPGPGAEAKDRTAAFRGLIQASLVYSQKYAAMCARSLKITAQEKRMEMQRVIPWMSEMIANAWVLSGPDDMSIPSLDDVLKAAYSSRRDVDRIMSALSYQAEVVEESSEDLNRFLLKGSIQQAMAPLAAEIAYMNDSKDPKDSADLLEVFKNYLVKDISVFLTNLATDHLKIGETAKVDAVKSRIKQISTILLSDLRANFELTGKMPKKEEVVKERLPIVRGIVYQLDAMVDSAMAGVRLSVVTKEDLKAEEKAEVVKLKAARQGGLPSEKDETLEAQTSNINKQAREVEEVSVPKATSKGGPTL